MTRNYSKPSPTKLIGLLEAQGQLFGKQAVEPMVKKSKFYYVYSYGKWLIVITTMGEGASTIAFGVGI